MDGNELLMSGGIPSAKFPTIGTKVGGRILAEPSSRQQTDAKTQEPKFFKSGEPMMSVVVRLQTDERDVMRPDDDGERALYIKGKAMKSVREAVRRTGAKRLEVGGYLALTYVADEAPTGGLLSGAKVYTAEYVRPNPGDTPVDAPDDSFGIYPAGATATVTNPPPNASALPQSTIDGLNEDQRKALAAIGYKV